MFNHKSCEYLEKIDQTQGPVILQSEHLIHPRGSIGDQIRVSSSDRPRRLGHYINIIAAMGRKVRITKSQIRLIVLDLQRENIDDTVSLEKCDQEKIFIDTVRRYVNVNSETVRAFLDLECCADQSIV